MRSRAIPPRDELKGVIDGGERSGDARAWFDLSVRRGAYCARAVSDRRFGSILNTSPLKSLARARDSTNARTSLAWGMMADVLAFRFERYHFLASSDPWLK